MRNNLYSPAIADFPKYKKLHLVCSRPTKSHFLKSYGCGKVINNDIRMSVFLSMLTILHILENESSNFVKIYSHMTH